MVVLSVQLLYGLVCCARCGADLTWFAGGAISIPRVTLLEIDVMLLVALSKVPFMVNLIIKLSLKKLFLQWYNVQENEQRAAELYDEIVNMALVYMCGSEPLL